MAIHLGPPVARRLMRPTRGLGSAPLPRRRLPVRGLRPPIWPCSGWSLPVSLRSPACAVDRHRHCGTGPRLTADGRYPPPCAAELGLSSRRTTGRPAGDARPSDRLADRSDTTRRPGEAPGRLRPAGGARPTPGRRAATRSIASLASASATRVLGARHVGRRPAVEAGQRLRARRSRAGSAWRP